MDRASETVPAILLFGRLLLVLGIVVPAAVPRAASASEAIGLFTPGLACGPAETLVGTSRPAFLARVRADAGAAKAPVRPHGARTAARDHARSKSSRRSEARRAYAVQSAKRAPHAATEMRPNVLRSFFACNASTLPDPAAGTGWRLVGPLRQS